jgi:hypothetical protein
MFIPRTIKGEIAGVNAIAALILARWSFELETQTPGGKTG